MGKPLFSRYEALGLIPRSANKIFAALFIITKMRDGLPVHLAGTKKLHPYVGKE
jgi:hypothetical protein